MLCPPLPDNETQRLASLQACRVLDTAPEERFDRITRIAQASFRVEIALVSLVDADRQWFKSAQGLAATQTPRDISFCGHAILGEDIFEIPDALQDTRFADNPLVTGAPFIRFYAGMPLRAPDGFRVGTLCIIDPQPRRLDARERDILRDLARCVEQELDRLDLVVQSRKLQRANQLAEAITHAQSVFIDKLDRSAAFTHLLDDILQITESAYGFIGEVLRSPEGEPYLKTYAITDIAWDPATREFYDKYASIGMEFRNLKTLFGAALTSGEPVIANAPAADPRRGGLPPGHPALNAFLGLPVYYGDEMVAMLGLANRPEGYDDELLEFLRPFVGTLAQLVNAIRVREKIAVSEQRLRSIIDGTRIGTWEWNVQTGEAIFNERWAEMLGYTLDELAPVSIETWLSLAHPDDLVRSQELLTLNFNKTLDYYDCQCRMRHKAGHWIWVHDRGRVMSWTAEGKPLQMSGTHADISEQMATRHALEQEEARLRHLISNLPGTVYRCANDAHWTMSFISDSVKDLTGYEAREFLPERGGTRDFASLIHPEDAQIVNHTQERNLVNHDGFQIEYRIRHASGDYRWVQELGRGAFDRDGRLLHLDGFIWDVTEARRLDQMKNEFISTVSHELRTPLTSISAALGLVAGRALGDVPPAMANLIDIALRNSHRLGFLINDLLDMEKLALGKMDFAMQVQCLMPLLQEALDNNRAYGVDRDVTLALKGRSVALAAHSPLERIAVQVDTQRLMQVMANLLSNAIKFSPDGATVEVVVDIVGDQVRVSVIDRGPGIPIDFQPRIFQKFAQADGSDSRRQGGTGLGLAITRELVLRMGGRIDFTTSPGEGTTFFFEFPVWADA
jgi:PAS domain S-box-containing protein